MFNVDYFIQKFEKTREDQWTTIQTDSLGRHCAYGWCITDGCVNRFMGGDATEEGKALNALLQKIPNLLPYSPNAYSPYQHTPARINNGDVNEYQQDSPRKRILAALHDAREMENAVSEIEEIVATPQEVKINFGVSENCLTFV